MKPKLASVLEHIIDSFLVIFLAVIVLLFIWNIAQTYFEKFIVWSAQVKFTVLVLIVVAISGGLGWLFTKQTVASFRSLKLWRRHWGLAIRGFLGSIMILALAQWVDLLKIETNWFVMLGLVISIESLILLMGVSTAKLHLRLRESSNRRARNQQTHDEPIYTLEENLFPEYEITARRILSQLKMGIDEKGPNIALIGPYGSGKTSLCNLVKDIHLRECDQKSDSILLFCRFEAWQFLTTDAAIRGLLDEIVSTVQEQIDCLELNRMPDEYLEALGTSSSLWLRVLAIIFRKSRIPQEVIRALQDILLRTKKRVVIFVDDFDRLESSSKKTQDAIAAALNQLQNLTNVQYILCVGPMEKGTAADLLKLTRFQELMPQVRDEEVIETIKSVRDKAIVADSGLYYPWDFINEWRDDPLRYDFLTASLNVNLGSQIVNLIQTPRHLKAVERETNEKWEGGLKGEISWYDLLLISALKMTEKGVFEWIMRDPEVFLHEDISMRINEPTDEEKNEAKNAIESKLRELLETKTETRFKLVQRILLNLFPNFMKGLGGLAQSLTQREPKLWGQSIALKPGYGVSYFRRYTSGRVPSTEVPDQPTLRYIHDIRKKGFKQKDFEQHYLDSHKKLTNDLNRFVQFSELLPNELAMEVCDCMLEWICERQHWKVWDHEEQYVLAMMGDIKRIIDSAGQFGFARDHRRHTPSKGEWATDWLGKLVSKDIIVAIEYAAYVAKNELGEKETKTLLGTALKDKFFEDKETIWEKVKGHRIHLGRVLGALKYNDDYESIREQVTKSVLERIEAEKSSEFLESVVISLVRYQYPAGRPDFIDGYEFHVDKEENQKTYDMNMLLPLIKRCKGREFKDPVSAKAYEHLLKAYAEELSGIS
jgi:hypothetical protein